MSPDQFSLYLSNLVEADLLAPETLLILFGGEILNHPQCLEICRIASETRKPGMNLVMITSGKYRDEFSGQVDELIENVGLLHHWEVSIKDLESFRFGIGLIKKGHEVLFRYDFLNATDLKSAIDTFFRQVKACGLWKEFRRNNPKIEKVLRFARKKASDDPDSVIIEEFFFPDEEGELRSVGLTFSPLDRSVLRKGGKRAPVQCSLFGSQYQTAIHVTKDGSIYPCHLPRFKKRCEPIGNASELAFLLEYRSRIDEFKDAVAEMQETDRAQSGICIEGCRGKISLPK